jgi:hypothetical protein
MRKNGRQRSQGVQYPIDLTSPVAQTSPKKQPSIKIMTEPNNLRYKRLALGSGSGAIPALGFGTLIPDPVATKNATKAALEAGFRALDTAEPSLKVRHADYCVTENPRRFASLKRSTGMSLDLETRGSG